MRRILLWQKEEREENEGGGGGGGGGEGKIYLKGSKRVIVK